MNLVNIKRNAQAIADSFPDSDDPANLMLVRPRTVLALIRAVEAAMGIAEALVNPLTHTERVQLTVSDKAICELHSALGPFQA